MSHADADAAHAIMPAFRFTEFYEGDVRAWGVFVDLFGVVRQHLKVRMNGHWQGPEFHLEEKFEYGTGETETRCWVVRNNEGEGFTAHCADCPGPIEGHNGDDTILMRYDFNLVYLGRKYVVSFDDRLFRLDVGRAFNKAAMKKFGLTLGHVLLFVEKAGL